MNPMKKRLRVLVVEDSPDDAELVLRELRRGGYEPMAERVETSDAMQMALLQEWDLVIADHSLPHFNSFEALAILKQARLDLPLIIVSGVISEETAVAVMKIGAYDYVAKGNLGRLGVSVRNALHEAEERRRRKRAEQALCDRQELFRTFSACSPIGILLADLEGRCLYSNPRFRELFGFLPKGSLAEQWTQAVHPDDRSRTLSEWRRSLEEAREQSWELRLHIVGPPVCWVRVRLSRLQSQHDDPKGYLAVVEDISERKHLQEQLQQAMTMGDFTQSARNVAHDLNNLMGVILAHGEMALLRLNPADPLHGHVSKMSQAAQRATALASDLMRSRREPGSEPTAASLDASAGRPSWIIESPGEWTTPARGTSG
jgi:PAS domain S-box-containing protein